MNMIPEIMPKRKKKVIYPGLTKEKLKKAIQDLFDSDPKVNSKWHEIWNDTIETYPKTPTESFRFEIMDFSSKQEVGTEEASKGPKIKLTL